MPAVSSAVPVAHGPLVSVVVPVRDDRRGELKTLIDALGRQTLPPDRFEIVIGDDGSTDGATDGIATADGRVRVEHGPALNSYAARNRAARAARGRVLAFCDSDCVPEPDWLERGVAALATADAAAGRVRFVLPEEPTVWALLDIEYTKDHERQVERGLAETCNLFLRRELWERLGGFDDSIPEHGDFDFAQRLVADGARLVFAGDAVVHHPTRNRAKPFLRMIWMFHRWYAAREAREGRTPLGIRGRRLVPLVSVIRARRRFGVTLRLDRRWLGENGVRPRLRDDLLAAPLLYLFLPYFQSAAQARGWLDGRRLRDA